MFAFLEAFFSQYGYAAVFLVLIACGFGVPIPEDITLVTGGVISGLGQANAHMMVLVGMLGVLAGDGLMFVAGRVWGHRILDFKPVARVMTPKRYAQVQEKFDKYGNWVLFVARFLPGLRTAVFVTAGISRKVSYLRFILMDGLAALISVPAKVHSLQSGLLVLIGIGAAVLLFFWWRRRRRISFFRAKLSELRDKRKAARAAKAAKNAGQSSE